MSAFRRRLHDLAIDNFNLHELFHDVRREDLVGALSYAMAAVNQEAPAHLNVVPHMPPSVTIARIMYALDSAIEDSRLPFTFSPMDVMDVMCQAALHSDSASMFRMLLACRNPTTHDSIVHSAICDTLTVAADYTRWATVFVTVAVGAMVTDPQCDVPYLVLQEVFSSTPPPGPCCPGMVPSLLPAALRIPVDYNFCERIVMTGNASAIAVLLACLRDVAPCPIRLGPVTHREHWDVLTEPLSPLYSIERPPELEAFGPRNERQWDSDSRVTVELYDMVLPLVRQLGFLPTFDAPLVRGGMLTLTARETEDDVPTWDAVITSAAFHRHLLRGVMGGYGLSFSLRAAAIVWHRMPSGDFVSDLMLCVQTQPLDVTVNFLDNLLALLGDALAAVEFRTEPAYAEAAEQYRAEIASIEAFLANVTVALCYAFAGKTVWMRGDVVCHVLSRGVNNDGTNAFVSSLHRLLIRERFVTNVLALDPGALMQTVRKTDIGADSTIFHATPLAIFAAVSLSCDDDAVGIDAALSTLIEGLDLKDALAQLPSPTALLEKHLVFRGLRRAWVHACIGPLFVEQTSGEGEGKGKGKRQRQR
jgi:hypothetical protein